MTEREKLLAELAAVEAKRAERFGAMDANLEVIREKVAFHREEMHKAERMEYSLLNEDHEGLRIRELRRELEKHTPEEIKDCWKKIHYQLWYLENELPVTSANRALILERRKILEDAERAAEELRFRIVDDLPAAIAKIMATIPKGQP